MPPLRRRSCRSRKPRGRSPLPLVRTRFFLAKAACAAGLLAACATAQKAAPAPADDLKELRLQLEAQSSLVAQQQRRIEELEVKIAAIVSRSQVKAPPAVPEPAPAQITNPPPAKESRPSLKTVKLGEGKGRRAPLRADHPGAVAPQIPAAVELAEPDEDSLARLETDPDQTREFNADHAWATAVQEFNDGQREKAEKDFLAFAGKYPRHSAADNALALAGLARELRGDCKGALPLFESVPQKYPAGDAVPQAMLERGRCLRILGRKEDATPVLQQLLKDHPDSPEAQQAQRLLLNP
jgi:TolA-binding protein